MILSESSKIYQRDWTKRKPWFLALESGRFKVTDGSIAMAVSFTGSKGELAPVSVWSHVIYFSGSHAHTDLYEKKRCYKSLQSNLSRQISPRDAKNFVTFAKHAGRSLRSKMILLDSSILLLKSKNPRPIITLFLILSY